MLTTNCPQKEIKKTIPFTIASKRIKYLGINVTKELKRLLHWKLQKLVEEINKTQINGKTSCVHELENLILLLKCPYNPKHSTDSVQSLFSIKI